MVCFKVVGVTIASELLPINELLIKWRLELNQRNQIVEHCITVLLCIRNCVLR